MKNEAGVIKNKEQVIHGEEIMSACTWGTQRWGHSSLTCLTFTCLEPAAPQDMSEYSCCIYKVIFVKSYKKTWKLIKGLIQSIFYCTVGEAVWATGFCGGLGGCNDSTLFPWHWDESLWLWLHRETKLNMRPKDCDLLAQWSCSEK